MKGIMLKTCDDGADSDFWSAYCILFIQPGGALHCLTDATDVPAV